MHINSTHVRNIDAKLADIDRTVSFFGYDNLMLQIEYFRFNKLYGPGEGCSFHVHDNFHFQYVLQGRVQMQAKNQSPMLVQSGECCMIPPGVIHGWECQEADSAMLGFSVYVSTKDEVSLSKPALRHERGQIILQTLDPLYQSIFLHVVSRLKDNPPDNLCLPLLYPWIFYLFGAVVDVDCWQKKGDAEKAHIRRNERISHMILSYIKANYSYRVHCEDIANHFGLSTGHMNRVFKSIHGVSIMNYLIQFRLKKAHELLSGNHTLSIKEICYACGFYDQAYFSNCFKKKYGFSPKHLTK